jgi:hypothetical protein
MTMRAVTEYGNLNQAGSKIETLKKLASEVQL